MAVVYQWGKLFRGVGIIALIVLAICAYMFNWIPASWLGTDNKNAAIAKVESTGPKVKDIPSFSDAPVIRGSINTWGGYAGLAFMNGGLKSTKDSRYYKEYGIRVELELQDDFQAAHDAWKAGSVDFFWQTLDAFTTEVDALYVDYKVTVNFAVDKSRGGDVLIATERIKTVADLRGRKIAVALQAPSHTLVLRSLEAAGVDPSEVEFVEVPSALQAVEYFRNGQVDAAAVWSPDDEALMADVPGSHRLWSTAQAMEIIADVLPMKAEFVAQNEELVKRFITATLDGNGRINNDPAAKTEAVKYLSLMMNQPEDFMLNSVNKARLMTFGDNQNFFNLNGGFMGMTAERLYSETGKLFNAAGYAPANLTPWRQIDGSRILRQITTLTGPQNIAENAPRFAKATPEQERANPVAVKQVSINYALNSAELDANARATLNTVGSIMRANPGYRVRVEANTDNTGDDRINDDLSHRRAISPIDYLVQQFGFDRDRFIPKGNGSRNPLPGNTNSTAAERAANRRTEFQFLTD